ncbi:hypothetical protein E4T43_01844 [Aureobasidium subglaciale]|nr:hypothetical protein E4T43_01844 [Aureobasidium subglaciale]
MDHSTVTPPLLALPAELRLQIYNYVLGPAQPHLLSAYCGHNTWISPPLSRACSLFRYESLHLHFLNNEFIYDLRSPLEDGVKCLAKTLQYLREQSCVLGKLRFKHVSRGVLSMQELVKWVEIFVEYGDVLPKRSEDITFCQGPLRYREFAAQAAVALRSLIRFSAGINKSILGSGEEAALTDWIAEFLDVTVEGRVVLRGVRIAEEFVKGFRAAAGGEVQGANVLRWAMMSGGMIEGLKHAGYT